MNVHTPRLSPDRLYLPKTLRSHAKVRFFLTLLVTCATLSAGAILWSVKAHKPANGRDRLLVSTAENRLDPSLTVTKIKNSAAPVAMMVPLTGGGSITTFGSPLTENFDTLAQAGTNIAWTDDSTLSGGYSTRTTYNAGTGSSNTGALYSFGVAAANPVGDRALGGVGSGGTGTFYYAFKLTNNTGLDIHSLLISYNGEQWRDGGAATPVAQTTNFQYQVASAGTITDANTPATGWTPFSALSFTSPTFTDLTTGVALDGNEAANLTAKSAVLSLPTPATNGQEIWIRWEDLNDAGNDHGLAIDDLSITAASQEVSVAVAPADVNEDDAVDLVYTFTRTDTAGSLVVNFSVGGTADSATDYTEAGSTTFTPPTGSVTFADSSATAVVTITPAADSDFELNETVILTVTSGTGYSVGSPASATGTITNDDAVPFELVVNTTDDNNDLLCDATHCSLREAINTANLEADFNIIEFDIPLTDPGQFYYGDNLGPGVFAFNITSTSTPGTIDPDWPQSWWRITPGSALPEITTPLTIDGYSQRPCIDDPTLPCSQENTDPTGNNAILLIELDGTLVDVDVLADGKRKATQADGDGLVITDSGLFTTIMGLVINKWAGNGIVLLGGFAGGGNIVRGNFIGTDVSGTLAADFSTSFGNAVGLRIESFGNQVGCEVAEERNIISGNVNDGVQIIGEESTFNFIQGNFIGTGRDGSVIGNGGSGVLLFESSNNLIGGFPVGTFDANRLEKFRKSGGGCAGCCRRNSASVAKAAQVAAPPGNVIAGNGGAGVAVVGNEALDNIISQNSIFDNNGLGIDLNNDGVNPNDSCDDLDDGPNSLQNFPVISSAFSDGGTTTIQFSLDSNDFDNIYTIEFFTNTAADPSGYGEGRTFIGSTEITINTGCGEVFEFQSPDDLPPGVFVTATAIGPSGNTSEFGPNRMVTSPTAANSTISGAIVDDQGAGVAGVVINLSGTQNRKTITNAKGVYFFDGVEASGFYTVTPARANYSFSPALRSFNQLGNHTEAGFNASRAGDVTNPLDTAEFFVRQQYVDILGREPDEGGFNYWSNEINRCGTDAACVNARRRDIAAAFFIEQEFQKSGSYLYNLYSGGLGRKPVYAEYAVDRRQVVGGANLEVEKAAFAARFVQRADFMSKYQTSVTADSFVDALLQTVQQSSGVDLSSQRASLMNTYASGANTVESRSLVLRQVADNTAFKKAEYNAAFVLTEYFGYLKRDPEQGGFDFWLNVLNNREPGNFRGMVCSFITSTEYQKRFSSVVTHSNAECGR